MKIDITITNDKHPSYYIMHGYLWKPEGEVKAVIHVVHGMTEHIGRYEGFAAAMNQYGIAVAGYDLRGHGRNDNEYPAATFISGKNKDFGWETALQDVNLQIAQIRSIFPDVKYCLMGFSLGSFLVRDLMVQGLSPQIDGVILAGTGFQPPVILSLMSFITKIEAKRTPAGETSDLTTSLAFETYNKNFKDIRTPMDWLCSDRQQMDLYMHDPLTYKEIAADLFHEMIAAMKRTCSTGVYAKTPKDIPILLISGDNDAVGDMGVGVQKLYNMMKKEGLMVCVTSIRGARHDIFHECSGGQAGITFQTIAGWILPSTE